MTDRATSSLATAVAYQEVTLAELRLVFDQVDFDLRDLLERELAVEAELTKLTDAVEALGAKLKANGVATPQPSRPGLSSETTEPDPSTGLSRYAVPLVPSLDDFGLIVALAEARLEQLGVDLRQDPLLQVLPTSQVSQSIQQYADEYGETDWNETDWTVILAAGIIATLLDIFLVRIPRDETFLGKRYTGSVMTKWLQDEVRAERIHVCIFKTYEAMADVSYDLTSSPAVSGMSSWTHRLQSFGHDPLAGLLIGVVDLMHGTGTYVDDHGRIVQVPSAKEPLTLIRAMLTYVRHILSDFYTKTGVPPPLFSLLQVGHIGSPFALGDSGVKVSWTHVARYMYKHGYDLRHFFVSGIVPATVTAIVTGYWLLDGLARRGPDADPTSDRAKLASMLLVGHAIATSGNLLKTGVLFGMNPLALNWAQLLAMAPVTVAWIAESAARDARIGRALDHEWQRLMKESERLSRSDS